MTPSDLDRTIRRDLSGLSSISADLVARHLVMASRLLEESPELAFRHAMAAQSRGGRVGVVREAAGIAAYAAGHYDEALAQFRAARRISGESSYWPVMADCERGLGRPERALEMAGSPDVGRLDRAGQVEMRIVASGARRDLGQLDAAVLTLQGADLNSAKRAPWTVRLWYAYADALLAAGRQADAEDWFGRTAAVDRDGETDAAQRLAELQGVGFLSDWDDEEADDSASEHDEGDRDALEPAAEVPAEALAGEPQATHHAVDDE